MQTWNQDVDTSCQLSVGFNYSIALGYIELSRNMNFIIQSKHLYKWCVHHGMVCFRAEIEDLYILSILLINSGCKNNDHTVFVINLLDIFCVRQVACLFWYRIHFRILDLVPWFFNFRIRKSSQARSTMLSWTAIFSARTVPGVGLYFSSLHSLQRALLGVSASSPTPTLSLLLGQWTWMN